MFPGLGGAATADAPGGGAAAEPAPAKDGSDDINLCDMLDKPMCYARNENKSYPLGNLFIGDSRLGMQSDADEQLIIHLAFQEFVKVSRHFLSSIMCCEIKSNNIWYWLILKWLLLSPNQKVKSIKFSEWNMGSQPDMNPVTVHIHINRNNLGFEVSSYVNYSIG